MTRWLYSCLMWLVQPLLRRKLLRRSVREPGYGQFVDERFGRYAASVPAHVGPTVWLHAVSLGETRAAAVLVAALREQLPQMRLLLTHGTATGRAEGLKLLKEGDLQSWQPWDTPAVVQRFLTHFKPSLGILIETEVWPNLVAGCRQMDVPLVLANARLSEKSLRKAQKLAWLARPTFAALTAVWAQTPQDAQRLQALGARVTGVMGNLKFDAAPDARQLAAGKDWRAQLVKPVIMFASSREGEEGALLALLSRGLPQPDGLAMTEGVRWLIVPRHPQRFDEVAALIEFYGFSVQRRSSWGQGGPLEAAAGKPVIWLGDSLGEMALYYGLADLALLGGSFEPLGGQNLIEAAACGCPVIMGPHTFNFSEAAEQALAAGAALRVADLGQAVAGLGALLREDSLANSRQAAKRFSQSHQGAARRLADAVVRQLVS
jgi:3-deoxy-D-manno-octulosonic-acid transferase